MKTTTIQAVLTVSLLLAGCGHEPGAPTPAPSGAAAVAEPTLAAWQQGDKSAAVSRFLETDWSARPLFASSSPLSLSEEQFKALPAAERQAKSEEMMPQVTALKQLASAVAEAGRETAAKGDTAQARKHFSSVKQCGTALDSPDHLLIVQLVGQALKKLADAELAKLT